MKKHPFLIGAFVLIIVVGKVASWGLAAEPSLEEGATIRQLREKTAGETSGAAVLVARDGQIVFQGGFGLADVANKTPITPETKFRIGSVSKQFIAAAVLRLAEQGKLSLDDPLAKYFADFPRGGDVKLRQLLTHTSGVHSYTEKPGFLVRVKEPIKPADLIEGFKNDPPDFAPGKGFRYSNSGYFLLGEIVAQTAGKPLGDFLRETFFEPLGMKDTGIFVNASPPPKMALGYSMIDGKLSPAMDWDMSRAGGAGAIYSTVGDLFRWDEALFSGRVINEASFKAATTPVELPANVDGLNYGYGLMMLNVKRLPAIGHGGSLNGWLSELLRVPGQHCTVVVLSNALPPLPGVLPSVIARALIAETLADEIRKLPPLVEDKSIDPKSFGDYAGRYDYKTGIMTITVEDNGLNAQLTGQPKYPLFAKAKDSFFWKAMEAEVTFLRNEEGQVVAARHSQGGNTFRALKLDANAVQLTAEQVESYVGQYQYGPGAVMTISRENSQLFAQLTGQPKFTIMPTSETEFEWRVVAAKIEFVKDKDGKVTKAVHRQNGNTIDAPKIK